MALSVMQAAPIEDDGPGPKKIPGTGLTLYQGGIEKTPTGRSNSFAESGLTPEEIIISAKKVGIEKSEN